MSSTTRTRALAIAALGVVYGDIGTSPLYAFKEAFAHGLAPTEFNVLASLSAFFWAILLVITLKYILVVLRYHNKGEGGVLSLLALANQQISQQGKLTTVIFSLGVFAAGLFYADAFITPAISVLSAVEGTEIVAPSLKPWIIPITLAILISLFVVQRLGTQRIGGRVFGPIVITWFVTLAVLGIHAILAQPSVLKALNPMYAMEFFIQYPSAGILLLSAVFLALTGGEALYADMGHFGARPIRLAWLGLVWPSLVLNYFGQGALILQNPSAVANPFYLLAPDSMMIFLVILATLATIIASQATIAGAYSLTVEASRLNLLPRINVIHTSNTEQGQIYIPFINWLMLLGVVTLVLVFQSSGALAAAYGLAVSGTMLITSLLLMLIVYHQGHHKRGLMLSLLGLFATLELIFVIANSSKFFTGGWLPVLVGCIVFGLFYIWRKGKNALSAERRQLSLAINQLPLLVNDMHCVQGTAIYLSSDPDLIPSALLHNLKHYQVIHQHNVCLTVETLNMPFVDDAQRVSLTVLSPQLAQLTIRFGFREEPLLMPILQKVPLDWSFDPLHTSFFVSDTLIRHHANTLNRLEFGVFNVLFRQAGEVYSFFGLPANRTVMLGTQVNL
ncbi:potassium transporter Kup [Agitococcus lubricus]|uniref:Probable potassium transport system protein Kup n=1 Tax=Agitococcus lubricus TaxID=1077255 RepID=A0A2T5J1C6_9GAMM|nr:KUP/HAK/KT family potassium transporter [Agitococcus lubricus]PTQ90190.1 KUP system potassium uptake protein [Agitococcus lubricus]